MAWMNAAMRWPDAVTSSDLAQSVRLSIKQVRPKLPHPVLRELPDGLLVAIAAVLVAISLTVVTGFLRPTPKGRVSAHAISGGRRQRSGARTVLLVGPSDSGKTSIFSALVFGSVSKTHTSQSESEGHTLLGPPAPLAGEEHDAVVRKNTPVHLVDLPGHPRLRTKANDFLTSADALVFCVDATLAARAATAAAGASPALSEAVDHFHSLMTSLASLRLKSDSTTAAPALQVLFTRSDLSPLLSQQSNDATQLAKRKAQLLQRARSGFEVELSRRRNALQAGRTTKLGGIGRVQGGGGSEAKGLFSKIRKLLGLGASSPVTSTADEEEEEEEQDYDYFAWEATSQGTTSSLDRLDEQVVEGGKAHYGLISLGRERDWFGGDGSRREGKDDRDLRAFLTSL